MSCPAAEIRRTPRLALRSRSPRSPTPFHRDTDPHHPHASLPPRRRGRRGRRWRRGSAGPGGGREGGSAAGGPATRVWAAAGITPLPGKQATGGVAQPAGTPDRGARIGEGSSAAAIRLWRSNRPARHAGTCTTPPSRMAAAHRSASPRASHRASAIRRHPARPGSAVTSVAVSARFQTWTWSIEPGQKSAGCEPENARPIASGPGAASPVGCRQTVDCATPST